jgi:hypothetical protein
MYFSFGTSHDLMFLVRSNWLIGGPPEFMKNKLAKGKYLISLFCCHSHCTTIAFTFKGKQRYGGDCIHEWFQKPATVSLSILYRSHITGN